MAGNALAKLRVEQDLADTKDLKKEITRVTPLSGLFEPTQVRAYFRQLTETLQGIWAIAEDLPEAELLDIVSTDKNI